MYRMHIFQIRCQDQHTYDEFTCIIRDWIRSGDGLDCWKEFPVLWPGLLPSKGKLLHTVKEHKNKQ